MFVFTDAETIPSQKQEVIDSFFNDAQENFSAPKDMSKKRALEEMNLNPSVEPQKYWTKADSIKYWEDRFREEKADEIADEKYRKTSLDATFGELVSISWSDGNSEMQNVYRELGSSYTEYHMLEEFFTKIHEMLKCRQHSSSPYFVGHNVEFDLGYFYRRAVILRIDPGFKIPFDGRHGSDYYDTMLAWAGYKGKISQNKLAAALGIPEKPDDIDGSKVWDFVKAGNAKRVAEYNNYDVETVIEIYNRLTFKTV